MVIDFKNNGIYPSLKDIFIRQDGKTLKIFYGATDDLYFDIFGDYSFNESGIRTSKFCIVKDSDIYSYFDNLFNAILNCEVYDDDNDLDFISSYDGKNLNKKLQESNANSKLVKNGNIEWYSDSIYDEKANLLIIERTDEGIVFSFFDNPDDPTFGFGIRICNSSSKYDPFNLCFMKLLNQFQKAIELDGKSLEKKLIKPE